MSQLTAYFLNKNPETFYLTEQNPEITVGRGKDNTIVLEDFKVSRNHGRFYLQDSAVIVEDKDSTNGIYVNKVRVSRHQLKHSDEILIGDTLIIYSKNDAVQGLLKDLAGSGIIRKKSGDDAGISANLEKAEKYLRGITQKSVKEKSLQENLFKVADALKTITAKCREMEKSYEILYTMQKINQEVNSVYSLKELLNLIIDVIIPLMNAERGFLMLINKENGDIVPAVARKMNDVLEDKEKLGISKTIAKEVIRSGKSTLTTDAMMDPRFMKGMSVVNSVIRSVMCVPLKTRSEIIGVVYVDNRQKTCCFNKKDLKFLEGFASHAGTAIEKTRLYADLEESYLASVEVLANVLDASDPYTHGHSLRVTRYALAIAEKMNFSDIQLKNLRYGALLHDIGKVGIPNEIINKNGRLSDEEFKLIKDHPAKGFEIIQPIKFLQEKLAPIKYHHEKFDGSGYPEGLMGEKIPLEARVVAVADAFDAMTSTRSYRQAMGLSPAMEEIRKNSGKQFDPKIVNVFSQIIPAIFDEISKSDTKLDLYREN